MRGRCRGRGRGRLCVPPIGEVRRHWAAISLEEEFGGEEKEVKGEAEWCPMPLPEDDQRYSEPPVGRQPNGGESRFWSQGVEDSDTEIQDSLTSEFLLKQAAMVGFSAADVERVDDLLHNDRIKAQAIAKETPPLLEEAELLARRVLRTLVNGRKKTMES